MLEENDSEISSDEVFLISYADPIHDLCEMTVEKHSYYKYILSLEKWRRSIFCCLRAVRDISAYYQKLYQMFIYREESRGRGNLHY
jgi:hypothetical protein